MEVSEQLKTGSVFLHRGCETSVHVRIHYGSKGYVIDTAVNDSSYNFTSGDYSFSRYTPVPVNKEVIYPAVLTVLNDFFREGFRLTSTNIPIRFHLETTSKMLESCLSYCLEDSIKLQLLLENQNYFAVAIPSMSKRVLARINTKDGPVVSFASQRGEPIDLSSEVINRLLDLNKNKHSSTLTLDMFVAYDNHIVVLDVLEQNDEVLTLNPKDRLNELKILSDLMPPGMKEAFNKSEKNLVADYCRENGYNLLFIPAEIGNTDKPKAGILMTMKQTAQLVVMALDGISREAKLGTIIDGVPIQIATSIHEPEFTIAVLDVVEVLYSGVDWGSMLHVEIVKNLGNVEPTPLNAKVAREMGYNLTPKRVGRLDTSSTSGLTGVLAALDTPPE